MSRLLFAAARGARTQRAVELLSGERIWEDIEIQWSKDDELRIHPEDEHLQYGPISTALREDAQRTNSHQALEYGILGGEFRVYMNEWLDYDECKNELHRSLFLLILAEALADEGL